MKEYTLLQKYILDDLDEFDECNFFTLVPSYKEIILKEENLIPLWDYKENFEISDQDFNNLKKEVLELMEKDDIGLYIDIGVNGQTWEECFKRLSDENTECILSNKENWVPKQRSEAYWLIRNIDIQGNVPKLVMDKNVKCK